MVDLLWPALHLCQTTKVILPLLFVLPESRQGIFSEIAKFNNSGIQAVSSVALLRIMKIISEALLRPKSANGKARPQAQLPRV
jgi:hypothetical protein